MQKEIESFFYGNQIHNLAKVLWPLNRSITGEGVRQTLSEIKSHLPELINHSIASGTKVFDWIVPKEWQVREAYIIDPDGKKICDFSKNNLHLVGYSIPFKGTLKLKDLKNYLYTLPEQPNAIPYVTSYYKERWGFCLSELELKNLKEGDYKVVVDTKLFNGNLNYGELILPGKKKQEIFLSTYICHPSMANNELSGPSVLTYIAKWLKTSTDRNYTYRIIFVPETIGSITYLSYNYKYLKKNVIAGFNVSCVGDNKSYSYLPSRNGKTLSDIVAKHVLKWTDPNYISYKWKDRGSDERQYCAPGIDLPIASIMRSKFGEYPEYHTSLDDLNNLVTSAGLDGGYWALRRGLEIIENNQIYVSNILCEPQMSNRGMYPDLSSKKDKSETKLIMNILSLCDGSNTLLDIATILETPAWNLYASIEKLLSNNLIAKLKKD